MNDLKLKIRHAKRGNSTALDLSNLDISELPVELYQLSSLESLNISGNKIASIDKLHCLHNLKRLNASNNLIASLPQELIQLE